MFKNYLKIAARNIFRNRTYSIINILGLSIGIACSILILLWVNDELSYDRYHKNADEIYWIVEDDIAQTGLTLYPKNIAEFSDSISITRTLKTCSNKTCESKGQLNISLQKLGAEIVETPYAYFEAYKFNVIFEITIQGENPVSRSVSGVHWLHPAIGVVKFSYDVYDASNSATLIGTLTDTNISIPSRYKKPGS